MSLRAGIYSLSLSGILALSAHAALITSTPTSVWEQFPKTTQGENGIRAQSRAGGSSTYYDLTWSADYTFITSGALWQLPKIWRYGSISDQRFVAEPADESGGSFDRDAIIRVGLTGDVPWVRVTGSSGTDSSASMTFYVYKGANNWSTPLWQGGVNQSFDFTTTFTTGDEIFFGVDAGASCVNDWGRWRSLTLTGIVPEPGTAALLAVGCGCLMRRRCRGC
jgi:hypothetical protein